MEYLQPRKIKETLSALRKWEGKALLVAGGTNVLPDLRAKNLQPEVLIDISRLKPLSYIRDEKDRIRIGALTPIAEIASSKILRNKSPILCDAAAHLGNPLVRNRATLGGNLAKASPAADTAVPLLALDAVVTVESEGFGRRKIPLQEFFLGPHQTALSPKEIIREISFAVPGSRAKMAYRKLGRRGAMAISVVSLAVFLEIDKGVCWKARIGMGAVAPTPIRAYKTEEILEGKKISEEDLGLCRSQVEKEVAPIDDIRASAEYRRMMASSLLQKTLGEALEKGKK